MGADNQDNYNGRAKKVTGTLYECLAENFPCHHKFSYGFAHYCEWLLKNRNILPEQKLPCITSSESGKKG